jgi:hypothetical protein
MESVEKWLDVKAALRAARKEVLKGLDLTEDGLRELEASALKELEEFGGDYETEHGVAYLHEIQSFAHKNSVPMGTRKEIKSRRKE